jgi:TetR/AcrR family transcriptional regulator, cholesterol catabolism regulator
MYSGIQITSGQKRFDQRRPGILNGQSGADRPPAPELPACVREAHTGFDWMNKKKQLLQGIAELFFLNGYEKTAISDICAQLAISRPGLYYHFTNKQEMLFEIISDFLDKIIPELRANFNHKGNPEEKLRTFIRSSIQFFIEYPAQTKVVIYEIHSLEEKYARALDPKRQEYFGAIRNIIIEILKDSGIESDPTVATFALIGTLNWVVQWYQPEGKIAPDALAKSIEELYLRALKA